MIPGTPTTLPALATVIATVRRQNGTHPELALRGALRLAGIPPDAPYVEWHDGIPRALTLLETPIPQRTG